MGEVDCTEVRSSNEHQKLVVDCDDDKCNVHRGCDFTHLTGSVVLVRETERARAWSCETCLLALLLPNLLIYSPKKGEWPTVRRPDVHMAAPWLNMYAQ